MIRRNWTCSVLLSLMIVVTAIFSIASNGSLALSAVSHVHQCYAADRWEFR